MQLVAVSSSAIASVGFDSSTHTLDVRFHSGKNYRYFMVPASVYERMLASDSIGAFFNREIRDKFRFVELP
jgi:KTSC domain